VYYGEGPHKTHFIRVETDMPWVLYYIVANRPVTLADFAAAKLAITRRFMYMPPNNPINRMRMDFSLSAHLEALLFFNRHAIDPCRCTFVFATMGGHIAKRAAIPFIKREYIGEKFDQIFRFMRNLPILMTESAVVNRSFIDLNLSYRPWVTIGKGYTEEDMVPAIKYTAEYRELNDSLSFPDGETEEGGQAEPQSTQLDRAPIPREAPVPVAEPSAAQGHPGAGAQRRHDGTGVPSYSASCETEGSNRAPGASPGDT
jgi:hypothetical protein